MKLTNPKPFYHNSNNIEEVSLDELLEGLTLQEAKGGTKNGCGKKAKEIPSTRCLATTKKGVQCRNKVSFIYFGFILFNR